MSNDGFLRGVMAVAAIVLGLAWVAIVACGILFSFKSGTDPSWVTSEGMKYFVPGLTALIGGVVATAFGIAAKDPNNGASERVAGVVKGQGFGGADTQVWIGRFYITAYLLLGAAAAVTWVFAGGDTIDFIRTLAPAWGGLALAIATAYMNPKPASD